jgi:hypothetical protein
VLDCEQDAVEAELALFERHDPTTLAEAAHLIEVGSLVRREEALTSFNLRDGDASNGDRP